MASANVLELTAENWEQEVVKSDKPVLVDFWAVWCGPCRALAPTIDRLADQFHGKVKVGKVNTDDNAEIAGRYGISSIPSVLLFNGGEQPVERSVGVPPAADFHNFLNRPLDLNFYRPGAGGAPPPRARRRPGGLTPPARQEQTIMSGPYLHPTSRWRWLCGCVSAIVRQRCPRCWKGRMFSHGLTMNDPCPECSLIFQREEGYFLGAMYVSYGISSVLLTVFFFTLQALLPGWNGLLLAGLAVIPYLPFIPAVFRYSRLLWVWLDRFGDFSDVGACPYEKVRRKQWAEQGGPRSGSGV
jgi:thioredoxin 1